MKKVYQENISNINGDCMRAVIASLFDDEITKVPNFIDYNEDWFNVFVEHFKRKGYEEKIALYNPIIFEEILPEYSLDRLSEFKGVNGFFYATVCSPTYNPKGKKQGITHAVVVDGEFNIVHDPNPDYKNIKRKYPLHDKYNGIRQVEIFERKLDIGQ